MMKNIIGVLTLFAVLSQTTVQAQVFSAKPDSKTGLAVSLIPQKNSDGSIDVLYCRGAAYNPSEALDSKTLAELCVQKKVIGHYKDSADLQKQMNKLSRNTNWGYGISALLGGAVVGTGVLVIAVGGLFDLGFKLLAGAAEVALSGGKSSTIWNRAGDFMANNKSAFIIGGIAVAVVAGGSIYTYHKRSVELDAIKVLVSALTSTNGETKLMLRSNAKVQELRETLGQKQFKGELN